VLPGCPGQPLKFLFEMNGRSPPSGTGQLQVVDHGIDDLQAAAMLGGRGNRVVGRSGTARPLLGAGAGVEANYGRATLTGQYTEVPGPSGDAVGFAACKLAAQLDARAVIAAVGWMAEAAHLARFRPQVPLVMITNSMRLYRGLALVHGVAPLLLARGSIEPEASVNQAREWLLAHGLAQPGDRAVLLYASETGKGEPDSLRLIGL